MPPENQDKLLPFQYVLCAATSPAVKLHDETLTYLNQGEPTPVLHRYLWNRPKGRFHLWKLLFPRGSFRFLGYFSWWEMGSGSAFTWLCSAQVQQESPGGFHLGKVWVLGGGYRCVQSITGVDEAYLYRCVQGGYRCTRCICTGVYRVVPGVCKVYLYRCVQGVSVQVCAGWFQVCVRCMCTGVCKVYLYMSVLGSSAGWEFQVQAVLAAFRYSWKLWVGGILKGLILNEELR